MENASKALIIAGAILLSILIISLGILVYNNASSTIDDASLESTEIQTFNRAITQYCGSGKSASDMNGLVSAISASNGSQSKLSDQHYVGVTVSGTIDGVTGGSVTAAQAKAGTVTYPTFPTGKTYSATYTVDADGYVTEVTIACTSTSGS